jgi:hypothetical protein
MCIGTWRLASSVWAYIAVTEVELRIILIVMVAFAGSERRFGPCTSSRQRMEVYEFETIVPVVYELMTLHDSAKFK